MKWKSGKTRDNYFLSLFPKRVEDRQTDRQTDRPIRLVVEATFCCLKTIYFEGVGVWAVGGPTL